MLLDVGGRFDLRLTLLIMMLNYATMEIRNDNTILLPNSGSDVKKGNGLFQSTNLHEAARYNNTQVIELLLRYGASTNLKDRDGDTPIDVARANNNEAAVRLLERH